MRRFYQYRILVLLVIVISITYQYAGFLNSHKTYAYDEMMILIANCGNFARTSFDNPQRDQTDYFLVLISMVVVLATLIYSLGYLLRPDEHSPDHIKYRILHTFRHEKDR